MGAVSLWLAEGAATRVSGALRYPGAGWVPLPCGRVSRGCLVSRAALRVPWAWTRRPGRQLCPGALALRPASLRLSRPRCGRV